jgi:HD-GYP domain-containing protein (c-di-GMP phosphodiesterase class II)
VKPSALWSTLDELIDVDRTSYCVFEIQTWTRVHCGTDISPAMVATLRQGAIRAEGTAGRRQEQQLLMAHRDLYLRFEFGAPEWRLVTAEDRAEALAPAAAVTLSLGLMVALAIVSAFVLAHRQIRRSTEPLEALRDATRRVSGGDLTTAVTIQSRDEYGELGIAFNGMTAALSEQIAMLHQLDELDEISLRERRVEAILETALRGFSESPACIAASVMLSGARAHEPATRWATTRATPDIVRADVTIAEDERRQLLAHPRQQLRTVLHHGGATAPATRLVLPLVHDEELLGAIALDLRGDPKRMKEGIRTARRVADRVVLGIANVRLLHRLDALSSGTLRAFAQAIDANSHWTAGHSERVTHLAMALGRQLGLTPSELSILYRGGLMHDIGKIGIPPTLLDKASALTDTERATIERHPEIGERILKPIPAFTDALPIVRSHHERFDGTGYPDRLCRDDIPWLARVLAVADVFDALVSDRPYREGLSIRAAIAMIEMNSGSHFDPRVVSALLSIDVQQTISTGPQPLSDEEAVRTPANGDQRFSLLSATA